MAKKIYMVSIIHIKKYVESKHILNVAPVYKLKN